MDIEKKKRLKTSAICWVFLGSVGSTEFLKRLTTDKIIFESSIQEAGNRSVG